MKRVALLLRYHSNGGEMRLSLAASQQQEETKKPVMYARGYVFAMAGKRKMLGFSANLSR